MRKVLVLGASGFIGYTLCEVLSHDYEVYGSYYENKRTPDGTRMVRLDLSKVDSMTNVLETIEPDVVISSLRGDFAHQLLAHEQLAHYLADHGGRLIYLSTANVFDAVTNKAHPESDEPSASSEYGQFKITCEKTLKQILGPSLTIARLPMIFGPDGPRIVNLMNGLKKGQPIAVYRDTYISVHHTHILARQLAYMIEQGSEGLFHLGSQDVVKYDEFMSRLAKSLGFSQVKLHYERIQDQPYYLALASEKSYFPVNLLLSAETVLDLI